MDLLFTQVRAIDAAQQQLAAQLELSAKAFNQSTQDQLLLSKQFQSTGDVVARLTLWQMKMDAAGQPESPRSDFDEENPFSSAPPGWLQVGPETIPIALAMVRYISTANSFLRCCFLVLMVWTLRFGRISVKNISIYTALVIL